MDKAIEDFDKWLTEKEREEKKKIMESIRVTISCMAFIISPNKAHVEVMSSISIQRENYSHTNLPPISVSQEALEEFKQLYKQEYGIDLDDRTGLVKAEKTLLLVSATYFPIPANEAGKLNNKSFETTDDNVHN